MHQKNYKKVKFQHVSAECVWSTAEKYPISGHAHNSRTVIGQKKLLMDTIKTQLRQNNTKISAESEMTLCHTSRRRWNMLIKSTVCLRQVPFRVSISLLICMCVCEQHRGNFKVVAKNKLLFSFERQFCSPCRCIVDEKLLQRDSLKLSTVQFYVMSMWGWQGFKLFF
mgnify:CR=1 FL=1